MKNTKKNWYEETLSFSSSRQSQTSKEMNRKHEIKNYCIVVKEFARGKEDTKENEKLSSFLKSVLSSVQKQCKWH